MTRILIVEDDPVETRVLSRAFTRQRPDLTILTASNGREALHMINQRAVDLVITDLQMPEMDGFELLAWLHNNHPEVPVFAMSGYANEETTRRLDQLGAGECFKKPLDAKVVLSRVSDTLSQSVRGHVHNVSLASFLQLMEMERKTCSLTVNCDDHTGLLVLRKGELIDARTGDVQGEPAAIRIIAWPSPSISISGFGELYERRIETPLGFIVMEAMRLQDEAARNAPLPEGASELPPPRKSFRPPPPRLSSAPPTDSLSFGTTAVAIVDTLTGLVLRSAARDGCPIAELARTASQVLRQQAIMLDMCDEVEGIEELVLTATTHCDVIRPLNAKEFALLIFVPDETNLVMARLELQRFVNAKPQRAP